MLVVLQPRQRLVRQIRVSRSPGAAALVAMSGLALAGLVAGCGSSGSSDASAGADAATAHVIGTRVREVSIAGVSGTVLITRQTSPRGGYQLRLYRVDGGTATQLVDDLGNPLVPFVATDTTPSSAVTADCVGSTLRVTTADPGTTADRLRVRTMTYTFADGSAKATLVGTHVTSAPRATAAATLRRVAAHTAFVGCPSA